MRGVTVLLTLAVLACGGEDAPGSAAGGPPEGGPRPVAVETAPVERGTIAREVEVSGVVEPVRAVAVSSQLAAIVQAVLAEEGDRVGRGAVLARLDEAELAVELESARAALEVTKAAFERAERLREREVITLPEYERDRAALAAAEAAHSRLQTRLSWATVRSPIAGVVTEKSVEAGDAVAPQALLFRLADISTLVVRVGVSELDVGHLRVGDRIEVTLDAFPQSPVGGRIRRIFPTADPATRLVTVEIALDPGSGARPGYLARIGLRLDRREDAAIVPAGAILTGAGGAESVFVVEGGMARRREVETGLVARGRVEVVSGLRPGEVVVVTGNHSLREGAPVRPVTRTEVAEPAAPAEGTEGS